MSFYKSDHFICFLNAMFSGIQVVSALQKDAEAVRAFPKSPIPNATDLWTETSMNISHPDISGSFIETEAVIAIEDQNISESSHEWIDHFEVKIRSFDDLKRKKVLTSEERGADAGSESLSDYDELAGASCTSDDYKDKSLLPYLESQSEVHRDFDSFPVFLISPVERKCMIRRGSTAVSHLQQLIVDYTSNNRALVCDRSSEVHAHSDRPKVLEGTSYEGVEYHLVIPPLCAHVGAACPFVTALHGVTGDNIFGDAMRINSCLRELAVITLLPKIHAYSKLHLNWEDLEFLRPLIMSVHERLKHNIDFSRLYLFGQSMGGSGALAGGLASADLFTDVFSVSPQHFWTEPEESARLMEHVYPKWNERKGRGTRLLRRIMITIGETDAINHGRAMDVGNIPRLLTQLGVFSADLPVEMRFFPQLGHCSWTAAFNLWYSILWRGGEEIHSMLPPA